MKTFPYLVRVLGAALAASLGLLVVSCAKEGVDPHSHTTSGNTPAKSSTEAWGRINGIRTELASRVQRKELEAVHEIAESLQSALAALREAPPQLPADKKARMEGAVSNLGKALDTLHDVADKPDLPAVEKEMKSIDALMKLLAEQYPGEVSGAAPIAPSAGHDDHGAMGHGEMSEPTARMEIIAATPLSAGVAAKLAVKLTALKSGAPIRATDLELAHTKKVHLLIVDASLGDYHHIHPSETAPGTWSFDFTPRAGGEYVIFADLLPVATKTQEYVRGTIAVTGSARTIEETGTKTVTVDGYRFDLTVEGGDVSASRATLVKVAVTKPDGTPARNLEPLMGAFAHGVGFSPGAKTVMHVHPMGEEPTSDSQRGGPQLSFHLAPTSVGFQKFYVQVQIDGRDRFAGFGINVVK